MLDYINGFFAAGEIEGHLATALGGRMPDAVLTTMADFCAKRRASITARKAMPSLA